MEKPFGRRGNRAPNSEPILVRRRIGRGRLVAPAASLWTQRGLFKPVPISSCPRESSANNRSGATMPLESSSRGIFAVGDVRYGSVKRVGAAIGEGAAGIAVLHSFLAGSTTAARPRTASS
jgi:hypothetical protein